MRLALLAGISLLTLGSLRADIDPPSRVARLNYLSGVVDFQPAGVDDWVEAPLNRPLTTGDHIWADERARAELHIGSTAIRVGSGTGFSLLNLDDKTVQIRLSQGSLQIRLRRLDDDEIFEVDTPNLAFSLLRPGSYRIDVNPSGEATIITVRGGEGEGTGGGQAFPVHVRQQARVSGMDSPIFDVQDAPPPDGWDNWCATRERREEQAQSARYVSREVIGYEDLDEYGEWRPVPGYAMVWYPRAIAAGWAPYHNGHWAWVEPWGWTWVDEAPWGFAPFHYGRWVHTSGSWGWIPGPVVARPVYAPALVAWVGGSHLSLSVSIGGGGRAGVAWFPLGPGDVYVPSYRTTPRYFNTVNTSNTVVNNVNITKIYNTTVINNTTNVTNNNTNITEIKYVNRNAPGAVTAVPQDAFVRSRPVAQAAVAVPANVQAAPVAYAAPVVPTRQSVLGANAPAPAAARPPAAIMNRSVVAKSAPPPRPVPFAMKQEALQANPGRPVSPEATQQMQQRANASVRPLIRQAPPVAVSPAIGVRPAQPAAAANPPARTPQVMNPRMPQPAAPTGAPARVFQPEVPAAPPPAQPPQVMNPRVAPPASAAPGGLPQRDVEPLQPAQPANPHVFQPGVPAPPRPAQPPPPGRQREPQPESAVPAPNPHLRAPETRRPDEAPHVNQSRPMNENVRPAGPPRHEVMPPKPEAEKPPKERERPARKAEPRGENKEEKRP